MKQIKFSTNQKSFRLAYGGDLLKTRMGRSGPRPLDTKHSMHLVLRSSKAKGSWSFKQPRHEANIKKIIEKFSRKYGIRILSLANVGNHLHMQIKLANRYTYKPFIRAITAAIAMAVTGRSRWQRQSAMTSERQGPFWDRRPFTRIVQSLKAFFNLRDYIRINQLEGHGMCRNHARLLIRNWNTS